jgi:hypothetical protein
MWTIKSTGGSILANYAGEKRFSTELLADALPAIHQASTTGIVMGKKITSVR